MSKHPGKTAAQRRVLDEIGCGNPSPLMTIVTRNALLKKRLIEHVGHRILSGWPPMRIEEYQMTIPTHMQWCEYQAAHAEEP